MTDLKTANEQLAQALKALESPEHDTDVREAEACRNRLMELDERIGARIKAKLEAHRQIAWAWNAGESTLDQTHADASRAPGIPHPQPDGWTYAQGTVSGSTEEPKSLADAWTAHHEEHTGKYALAGEQVPDRVMVNGVAEMQQAAVSDEQ